MSQTLTDHHNPYVGPRPFERGETLYGRTHEMRELQSLLLAERIVLLYSPSGAGKTSLLQAALLPRLEKRFEVLPVARVNEVPPSELTLNRYLYSLLTYLEKNLPPEQRLAPAELAGLSLTAYLERRRAAQEKSPRLVLILDQFEEILTLDPTNPAEKEEFFKQVGEALYQPWLWAIFSLREDYIAGLDPYLRLIPTRLKSTFRLELLDQEATQEAIQGPAQEQRVSFSDAAAERLITDLCQVRVQQRDGQIQEKEGLYVEPVQLQVVCSRLWDKKFPPDTPLPAGASIEPGDVDSVGDVDTALAGYYAARAQAIAVETGLSERAIRGWCGEALITEQGLRSQVMRGQGQSQGLDNIAIQALVDAHLVRGEERRGITWYELAHDRLIQPVRDNNVTWQETHLQLLQRQAALWNKAKRPDGLLLPGDKLVKAEQWAKTAKLLDFEEDFLIKSQKARDAKRRRRTLNILGTVVAIILVVLSFIAIGAWYRAEAERNRAEGLAHIAQSRQLASQSANQLSEDWALALLLAIEASQEADTTTANKALREAFVYPGRMLTLKGHTAPVTQIMWNQDESRILSAAEDGTARLWDVQTGEELATFSGRKFGSTEAAWNIDETIIRTIHPDGTRFWDAKTGKELLNPVNKEFQPKTSLAAVSTEVFSPVNVAVDYGPIWNKTETVVLTADVEGSIYMWNGQTKSDLLTFPGEFAAWSPDGTRLLTIEKDKIRVWNISTGQEVVTLSGHQGPVWQALWNTTGTLILSTGIDGTTRIWDAKTGAENSILSGHHGIVNQAVWNEDERYVLTAGDDATARVWDIQTGTAILTLTGHQARISQATWSPNEKFILTASADGTAKIWDAKSGGELLTLSDHKGGVEQARWNRAGTRVLTASADGTARVWDAKTGEELIKLEGHLDRLWQATWNSDETRILTASVDGTARLWNTITREELVVFSGHADEVRQATFNKDESQILTASADGTARLWDAATGIELVTLSGQTARVWQAAWNPSETRILTASADGIIRQFYASLETLAESACRRAPRNMSLEEWHRYFPGEDYRKTCPQLPIHPSFLEAGKNLIRLGNIEGAIKQFETVQILEPNLNLDPRREIARALVEYGQELARVADTQGAMMLYGQAIEYAPDNSEAHYRLCLSGIFNQLDKNLQACEQAVKLADDETEAIFRNARGVARSLTGDFAGAIEDFRFYITASERMDKTLPNASMRKSWITQLEVNQNPFNEETLQKLRAELDPLQPPVLERSVRIGIHGRNDGTYYEADFRLMREAGIETIKMLSNQNPEIFGRIKRENPNIEFIVRLLDYRINSEGHPSPQEFADMMIPIMAELKPYVVKFEIQNEPNHVGRFEGWGATDADAEDFNKWFLEVYKLLKEAHPWAQLGYPGLAMPFFVHGGDSWVELNRPAIEQADWLGVHSYWQTPPGQESLMFNEDFGLIFKYFHKKFPTKPIEITEFGNSNYLTPGFSISEAAYAQEHVDFYQELLKYPYVRSASAFILSSPDRQWDFFAWRSEEGRLKPIVSRVGSMSRPPLKLPSAPDESVEQPVNSEPIAIEPPQPTPTSAPPTLTAAPPTPTATLSSQSVATRQFSNQENVEPTKVPYGENSYIYGLHDKGGEHLMLLNGEARGWVIIRETIEADPEDKSGSSYQDLADKGFGVIVVLANSFNSGEGTLPLVEGCEDFSIRVANFVEHSQGAHIWVIGNEMNTEKNWPRLPNSNQGQPITPRIYANCYMLTRHAIKSIPGHADDQVIVGAIGPWNAETSYDADPEGQYPANKIPGPGSYPYQGFLGDYIKYLRDILVAIGRDYCDGVAIHTYSHGYDPKLIVDETKLGPPFQDYFFNFYAYRDQMAAIPPNFRDLPVYLTEMNGDTDPDGAIWPDKNEGWVRNAYEEINNWNMSGNQPIRVAALYRWSKGDNEPDWSLDGKRGVQEDFKEAIARNYKVNRP